MAIRDVPTLDGSGRMFEKHVPAYLTQAEQSATYVRKDKVYVTDYLSASRVPGTTDDTAGFMAARSAAAAGKTLVIPPGMYKVSDIVEFTNDSVTVEARGAVINLIDDGTAEGVNFRASGDNFTWLSGTLTQVAAARTGVYGLISLFGVNESRIEALTTIGGSSGGVYAEGGSEHIYDACHVRDTKADGIHISRGTIGVTINSPVVTNVQDDAIAIVSVLTTGPTTHPQIKNVTINNPRVTGSTLLGSGVVFIGVADCALNGGVVSGMVAAGAKVTKDDAAGATMNASNVSITGTIFRNCDTGVSVGNSDDCTLTGIQGINNTDSGLAIVLANRLHVVGGKFRGNTGFGVYEASGTGNNVVGADLRGNTAGASQLASAVLTSCVTA